jgi:hypothetical protein
MLMQDGWVKVESCLSRLEIVKVAQHQNLVVLIAVVAVHPCSAQDLVAVMMVSWKKSSKFPKNTSNKSKHSLSEA